MKFSLALALSAALIAPVARSAAAPAAASEKEDAPKKENAKPKKKAAKVKKKNVESKYKSRVLSESSESHYRFDADGNPIEKKKPARKIKKKASSEDSVDKPACTDDAPCAEKMSSDADAL